MSTNPIALIQQKLDAIDRRWRWLTFWRYFGIAGTVFGLIWFALELCAWRKILTTPWIFYTLIGIFSMSAFLAFLAIGIYVLVREPKRIWLAGQLEKGCPSLLDRIHTLVFLEKLRRPQQFALKRKIEAQAAQVFEKQPVVMPLSSRPAWESIGLFALVLAAAIALDIHYDPFEKLFHPPPTLLAPKADTPFELLPSNVTETKPGQKPWGEVRIVAPGRNVKLTKIDVLPLQIEMTASANLQNPVWVTSINGGPEVSHELAPPTEPQYAVYQPLLYLDELKVSDWDVISYYAKVQTTTPAEYVSKIYFIEVRPFREDFHTGDSGAGNGKQGKHARDLLSELVGQINQQMDMIQETHLFQQNSYPTDELRKQDVKKLADGEAARATAANQFYGEIVAENENAPIGEILDHLATAEQHMDKATENLTEEVIPEAMRHEQGALSELVACRKSFLKTLSQHPGAFGDGDSTAPDSGDNPPIATAQDSLKAMSQVTEMHDRDEAALKKLFDLNMQQRSLAVDANANSGRQVSPQSERDLKDKVDRLMQDNPDLFRAADAEKAALEHDMSRAIDNLSSPDGYESQHYLNHAADDMNDLEKAVQKNHQLQQIAEAYKLKKIVDQNIQQLGQEKDKPGSLSPQDIKDLTNAAEHSTGTLKDIANSPGGASFGPELGQSLSAENQQALQQALAQLAQAQPGPASQGAAGAAQGNLAKVSQAFEQSQGTLTKQIKGQDQLQTPPEDALNQAAQQLQGLLLAQQGKQPPSGADQNKELGDIVGEIEESLSKDKTAQGADILLQAHNLQKAKDGKPVDPIELKKLLDQIQTMSAEANDQNKDKPQDAPITVIDSSKFPANYRDRIRTYYEQLSTHSP
jgi:hypothetical protein